MSDQPTSPSGATPTETTPAAIPSEGNNVCFGVDVGDLYVRATLMTPQRQMPHIVRNDLSNERTPACVNIGADQERVFGDDSRLSSNPATTVNHFISLRTLNDLPDVQRERFFKSVNFTLNSTNDGAMLSLTPGGEAESFSLTHILGMLLKRIFTFCAESCTDGAVVGPTGAKVVLTTPPYWREEQRMEMLKAALVAGVPSDQVRVVPSHVASLLYWHHSHYQELVAPITLAVVDVGHVQSTIAIATVSKTALNVHAVVSEPVGVQDIDLGLVERCAGIVQQKHQFDVLKAPKHRARLERQCRKSKETLSMLEGDEIQCEALTDEIDVLHKIDRSVLAENAARLKDVLKKISNEVLTQSGKSLAEIDRVEIIGGGTRVPLVQQTLKEVWQKDLSGTLDMSLAVATGASIYGILQDPTADTQRILDSIVSKADANRRILETVHCVKVEPEVPSTAFVSTADMDEWVTKEQQLVQRDATFTARQNAYNELEGFIFNTQGKLREKAMQAALGGDASGLSALLNDVHNWLEDDSRTTEELTSKLDTLKEGLAKDYSAFEKELQRQKDEQAKKDAEFAEEAKKFQAENQKQPRTDAERLKFAEDRKNQGNDLFKQQHYQESMTRYVQALQYIGELYNAEGESKAKRDEIALSCYLNIAAAGLKIDAYQRVIENCQKALEISKDSAKAYFRMGQAHSGKQEFSEAKKALLKAQELAPEDKAIPKEIQLVEKKQQAQDAKEKKMYSKMFG